MTTFMLLSSLKFLHGLCTIQNLFRSLSFGQGTVYIQKFNEIKDQYSYCIPIYPDRSKDNDRVGCGLIINNLSIKQRLPSNASIFTAEVTAIDLALDTIAESDDHFIIFSDSLSVLSSLHNKKQLFRHKMTHMG